MGLLSPLCLVIVETVEALSRWVGLNLEFLQLRLEHRTRHQKDLSGGHVSREQAEFLLFTFTSCVFFVLETEALGGRSTEEFPLQHL